jgi:serine/threonine protein kinase/tetratricopeptide (TPR) repeat protein
VVTLVESPETDPMETSGRQLNWVATVDGVQVAGPVATRLELGEQIPGTRYRIRRWLGEGSAGVVYECEHVDIERLVALKVLRPEVSPKSRRAQLFREEARAASRTRGANVSANDFQIGSPHIVEIYDFGELPDGRLWFAMELLVGKSLASELGTELGGNRIEPARAIGILRQVCKGLGAAHDVGIIHRDVKPPNIMLTKRNGRSDCVKIVDFGVAAMLADQNDKQDMMVGTPHYMAPEQTKGKVFDHRLDVYALGCTAYRMLAGRPPLVADSLFALLRKHREEMPEPLTSIAGCEDIPKALEAVIMRCLAKDPEDRYESMADLEAALCEAQIEARLHTPWDDLPLPAVDEARKERLLRDMPDPARGGRIGRTSWTWPATILASVALVAGSAAFVLLRDPAPVTVVNDDAIDAIVRQARAAAAQAFYVYPPIDNPKHETAYTSVLQLEAMDADAIARKAATDLRREFAETLVRLGDRYWEHPAGKPFAIDYYAQALIFDPANKHAKERAPLTPGELAVLRQKAGSLDFTPADLKASEMLLALADDTEAREEKLQEAYAKAGDRGMTSEANIEAIIRSEGITIDAKPAQRPKKTDAVRPSEVDDDLGDDLDDDDLDGALASSRNPGKARSLARSGTKALRAGQRDKAEQLFHRALDHDRNNAEALMGLSMVHYHRGSYHKAVRYGAKAVAIQPNNAGYRINLGDAHYKNFAYRQARKEYEKASKLGHRDAAARLQKVREKLGD